MEMLLHSKLFKVTLIFEDSKFLEKPQRMISSFHLEGKYTLPLSVYVQHSLATLSRAESNRPERKSLHFLSHEKSYTVWVNSLICHSNFPYFMAPNCADYKFITQMALYVSGEKLHAHFYIDMTIYSKGKFVSLWYYEVSFPLFDKAMHNLHCLRESSFK